MKTATKKPAKKASKTLTTKKLAMKTTTNLIIIDASSSMESKKPEVKGGLKELLAQIKADAVKDKKTVKATTIVVDFSGQGDFKTLLNAEDSILLKDDVSDSYRTRGLTALYDAIGKGFALVDAKEKNVFVSILTDGEENDSKEFDYNKLKELIEAKKQLGWVITFMGTTESAIKSARSIGISAGNSLSFADNASGVMGALGTKGHPGIFTSARKMYYSNTFSEDPKFRSSVSMDSLLEEAAKDVDKQNNDAKGTENKGKLPDNTGGTEDTK